jgi:large subunit ribosomal protein L6
VSRIGKQPIPVPSGVEVKIDGSTVTVTGPKGTLTQSFSPELGLELADGVLTVTRPSDERTHRSLHGLTRTLLSNMVVGVSEGFHKNLEIVGVGYRAELTGSDITFEVPANTRITVRGIDKQRVGQVAAEIRGWRPPEPYKGKGVRYEGEHVRRKVGKTAK